MGLITFKEAKMTGLEKVKVAVEVMENTMREYSEYGANDTEPHTALQLSMGWALLYDKIAVPTKARQWELFTHSMKCGAAGRALSKAARVLCKLVAKHRTVPEVREYVTNYCWRVDLNG
jgi:hypothetical protein